MGVYDFVVAGGPSPGADVDPGLAVAASLGRGATELDDGFVAAAAAAAFFFASAAAAASAKFLSTADASTG